jgi:hypothetical protein
MTELAGEVTEIAKKLADLTAEAAYVPALRTTVEALSGARKREDPRRGAAGGARSAQRPPLVVAVPARGVRSHPCSRTRQRPD